MQNSSALTEHERRSFSLFLLQVGYSLFKNSAEEKNDGRILPVLSICLKVLVNVFVRSREQTFVTFACSSGQTSDHGEQLS